MIRKVLIWILLIRVADSVNCITELSASDAYCERARVLGYGMSEDDCRNAADTDPSCAKVAITDGDICMCAYAGSDVDDGCFQRDAAGTGLKIYTCTGDTHENPRSIPSLTISSAPARTYVDPNIQCIRSGSFPCFQRTASSQHSSCHYFNPSSCVDTQPEGNWPDLQWCKWAEYHYQSEFSDICFSDCSSEDLELLDKLLYHCQYVNRCERYLPTSSDACEFCRHGSCVSAASKLLGDGILDSTSGLELLDTCMKARCYDSNKATYFLGGSDTTVSSSNTAARYVAVASLTDTTTVSCYGTTLGGGECVVITKIASTGETISSETFEFADSSGYVSHVVTVAISDMDVVVCYGVNGDTGIGKCLVATWSGNPTSLTFTTPYTFSETNQVSYTSIVNVDGNDQIVVCYSAGQYDQIDTVVREEEGFGWCASGSYDTTAYPNIASTFQIDPPTAPIGLDPGGVWSSGSHVVFNAAPTKHISIDAISTSNVIVCFTDNWDEVGTCVIGTLGVSATGDKSISFPEADGDHIMFNSNVVRNVFIRVVDSNTALVCYAVKIGFHEKGSCTGLDITGNTITVRSSLDITKGIPLKFHIMKLNADDTYVTCWHEITHEKHAVCLTGTIINDGSDISVTPSGISKAVTTATVSYFSADKLGSLDEVVACYFIDTHEGDSVYDGIGACSVVQLDEFLCSSNPAITNMDSSATDCAYYVSKTNCQIACQDGYWANEFARCENGVWDSTTQCLEINCPYDPLVSGGFDGPGTSCEGTSAGSICDVKCADGFGPNGVATCRFGKYDLDRECRATNREPLEFLDALNLALRDGTFRTSLGNIVSNDTNLQVPLLTQADVTVPWHPELIDITIYIVGLAIGTELTESNVKDAVVQSVQDDVTSRIASHQVVSVLLSYVDVASTFDSIHNGISTCVEAKIKIEFPVNPCVNFDSKDFSDENAHSCEWWSGKDCTLGSSTYGLTSSGQTDVISNCACACSLHNDWRDKSCVSSKNESVLVSIDTDLDDSKYRAWPSTSNLANLVDDDDSTDFILHVSKLEAQNTFTFPVLSFNMSHTPFPFVLNRYAVVSNSISSGYDPLTWKLEASNDLVTWTELHDVSTNPFSLTRKEHIVYEIANVIGYAFYRMRILSATTQSGVVDADSSSTGHTGIEFALADVVLYECTDRFPAPECNQAGYYGRLGSRNCFPSVSPIS